MGIGKEVIMQSWIHPKAEKGQKDGVSGKGLFAKEDIPSGTIINAKAGHIIDSVTLKSKADIIKGAELQIAENLYVAPLTEDEFKASMMYVNHSCEPNLGIAGNICAVTMRDVKASEELTLDYAMFMTDTTQEFDCTCGNSTCRKRVRNEDWQNPKLQKKYAGYFSWYLQQKILNKK